MKGKRVFELLNELTVTEHRQLVHYCSKSEDKRLHILYKVLKVNPNTIEDFNIFLLKYSGIIFKGKDKVEIEHICRRNLDYYASEIEDIMIKNYLISDTKLKNIILAETLEKSANPFLLEYYYDKAFKSAKLFSDSIVEIKAIRGKIRLMFNSQTESGYKEAVILNNQLKSDIENFYHDKYVDYFNNLSNVYLNSHLLVDFDVDKLASEIKTKISECNNIKHEVGYLISLARLNFKNENYFDYIEKAYVLLNESNIDIKIKNILERKILFLELIIGFYFNKNQYHLENSIERILAINFENKFIDNNTMFHKLLIYIINNRVDNVLEILANEKNYFKGQSKELKDFLLALILYKNNQIKKCLKIINELCYSNNYFVALFSKLTTVKIHIELGNIELLQSLIYNTERYVKKNSDKYTVYHASLYLLMEFKQMANRKTYKKNIKQNTSISLYHQFLLKN